MYICLTICCRASSLHDKHPAKQVGCTTGTLHGKCPAQQTSYMKSAPDYIVLEHEQKPLVNKFRKSHPWNFGNVKLCIVKNSVINE